MKIKKTLFAAALSGVLFSATNAHAVLTLTLDGQGVYDDHLNITWLQNANLAASNTFGVSGISSGGYMTWNTAQNWIAAMNTANYLGFNDWRLPTTIDIGNQGDWGSSIISSEIGHLYYTELGNRGYYNISVSYPYPSGLINTGPFSNIQNYFYLSSSELNTDFAYGFGMNDGRPQAASKNNSYMMYAYMYAWAIRPGGAPVVDPSPVVNPTPSVVTSPVPEPESYAMLLVGLGLLSFTVRRRKMQ